ncbi:MAG: helix-turn-helix domain-containing protein [Solirubrobacteraceae bacterium]
MKGRSPGSTPARMWSTSGAPVSEQFAVWSEICGQAFVPVTVERHRGGQFAASVAARRVGPIGVSRIESDPQRVVRDREHIDRDCGDVFFVNLPLSSGASAGQDGRCAELRSGDLILIDGARPFEQTFSHRFRQISLTLPHDLLATRLAAPWEACAVTIPGDQGVGAVASGAIRGLARSAGPLDRHAAQALGDQISTLLALAVGALHAPVKSASRALLLQAALDELERSLGEPDLCPARVAERIGVSTRYLHRLFADRGQTIGCCILERRLERCRSDLEDPAGRHLTVAWIACRHGFGDLAYFARAFKRRYGVTPSEHRRRTTAPA